MTVTPAVKPLWAFPFNAARFFQGVSLEWDEINRDNGMHHAGLDLDCPDSTPLKACTAATLIAQGCTPNVGAGHWLLFQVYEDLFYGYEHLSKRLLPTGTRVAAGDVVGLSGHSGNVTGPHLHLTVAVTPTLGEYSARSQVYSSTRNPRAFVAIPNAA